MLDSITGVFDTSDFPARWNCGQWSATHGWAHILADGAIFGAYVAIPLVLGIFVTRRRDVPFYPVFWLFTAFIFFCGFGHFLEVLIFWHPVYRFSAVVKVCTAVVSWATVAALLPVVPKALALRGLATANEDLQAEIAEREATERELRKSYAEMREFSDVVLDREERMIELKQEVNTLLRDSGRAPRYGIETTAG